jgi:hypothetical protein
MASLPSDPNRLPFQLDILHELSGDAAQQYEVPQGVKVALEGALPDARYLYLVQVDHETKYVTVLHPPHGDPSSTPPGALVRVPEEGWVITPGRGRVAIVGGLEPLSREAIAEIAGGREPPPGTIKVGGN